MDEEGDMQMRDANDVYSVPSSPSVKEEEQGFDYEPTTPTRTSQQRSSRTSRGTAQDEKSEETPSKAGVRSSGRQRKPPQRYVQEEQAETSTPASERKTATPRSTRTRGTRKTREVSEVDREEEGSPQPQLQANSLARTRSKRSVKFNTDQEEREKKESTPEDQDGIDDLVAMQLQQDLVRPGLKDNVAPPEPLPDYAEQFHTLFQSNGLQDELRELTQGVLQKLNGKKRIPLKGLESEYHKVHHLVEQTVTAGEGNSMLILGSRGSGKTAIVETALSSLEKEHANDFHVVRLNGFLHTDDRLALREMWRQLGREMNTEEEAGKVSSYADTMATLLALLSHPEELFGPSDGHTNGVTAAKSIVILLDEFDLFVSHPRQTLLYNLFDIAQARKAPIAVIGLTTKVDVTEMLEKRVKSRFSHRYVFVPLARSFEMFSEICFAGLDGEGSGVLVEGWGAYLKVFLSFFFFFVLILGCLTFLGLVE